MAEGLRSDSRVLVYSTADRIDDGIRKLPLVRALRHMFPQGRLVWLAGKGESAYRHALSPLVHGLLDQVIDEAGIGGKLLQLVVRPLQGDDYDLVIDTQLDLLTTATVRRIKSKNFVSGTANFSFSTVKAPEGYKPPGSEIKRLLDLLQIATGFVPEPSVPLVFSEDVKQTAARILRPGYFYAALLPAADAKEQRWPMDHFVMVAKAHAASGRVPVFVLGPEEEEWHPKLSAAVPTALFPLQHQYARPYQFRADLTIAILQRCVIALACDGIGTHLAAAAGIPLAALFGPSDPAITAPLARRMTTITAQQFGGAEMKLILPVNVLHTLEAMIPR